jgi:hypothetical protein
MLQAKIAAQHAPHVGAQHARSSALLTALTKVLRDGVGHDLGLRPYVDRRLELLVKRLQVKSQATEASAM